MHSASMKMTNAEFLAHTDTMIALLLDPLFMDKMQEAKDAAKEIQKVPFTNMFYALYRPLSW